jgi:hypothetical protein
LEAAASAAVAVFMEAEDSGVAVASTVANRITI